MHPSKHELSRPTIQRTVGKSLAVGLTVLASLVCALAAPVSVSSQTAYEVVSSFDGVFLNGGGLGTLIEGNDGNLYGTTGGGRFGFGTVIRIDAAGTISTLHHFAGFDGSNPAVIQATDGSLYGTTSGGGAFNRGTVFRMNAAGGLTTLHHFSEEDGSPTELIQGSAGTIYGVTVSSVFQLNPGGGVTTLHRFGSFGYPTALIQAADGSLYGTTLQGGPFGTVFRLDPSGTLTTLHAFSGTDGRPVDLIQGNDGDFYGVTASNGTIFRIDAAGTLTTLYRFPPFVYSSVLIQGSDGSFYGVAIPPACSCSSVTGYIFRFDPDGMLTTLHTFSGTDGRPWLLLVASDGTLYGSTFFSSAGGTLFKLDALGTSTTLHNFSRGEGGASPVAHVTEGNDGRLYGTTSAGGSSDLGTVFTIEPTGMVRILHSFTGAIGDGSRPRAGLLQASDGLFYGTGGAGINGGTVFAIDGTGALTIRHVFRPPPAPFTGLNPTSDVIQATDGRLYGVALGIYSLPLAGPVTQTPFAILDAFGLTGLIQARDGTLYGTSTGGGAFGTRDGVQC